MRRTRRFHQEEVAADLAADGEHRFRDVDFVTVQLTIEAFEVAQRLEACYPQAAFANRARTGSTAIRVAGDVGGRNHDLAKSRRRDDLELALQGPGQGRGVHAEVGEVHLGYFRGGSLCTSSNITLPK